ncbi:MAG: hypothetical protein ACLP1Q_10310 [Solirubrobacteraceae bacterium]
MGAVVAVALSLAGCASGSPQMGATTFINEHGVAAAQVAARTSAIELAVARLPGSPTRPQLQQLTRAASEARSELARASEWNVAGRGEEGAEEEDVPRAETQVTEGASELADALAALQTYARAPSAAALAGYKRKLAGGRTQWNEGIAQLWYLAHKSRPPAV